MSFDQSTPTIYLSGLVAIALAPICGASKAGVFPEEALRTKNGMLPL